jgi:squalene-associated FAD-dependent desaturase
VKIAIIGAGWAGMAAAVAATQAGHHATVFEASRATGGRARALNGTLPNGTPVLLDNGQHILIGAYTDTLRLMQQVGVDTATALRSQPMALVFPDGLGLRFPAWPTPLDALAGIVTARGWTLLDKLSLLRTATGWQRRGFKCPGSLSVQDLCGNLSPRVVAELIEPLCVSALNTPYQRASAQVFLRVMQDALFGVQGGSRLLLPCVDMAALFPAAAASWVSQRGAQVRLGQRATRITPQGSGWHVQGEPFDAVILATSASNAALALDRIAPAATEFVALKLHQWSETARALQFEAIATVYAWALGAALPQPMLTLRSHVGNHPQAADDDSAAPAQFVFDRGQLGGPAGLLAFVVSASGTEQQVLQAQVLRQARQQLGLTLQPVQTVVEKRATFACTPGLARPSQWIAPGLVACGDYIDGPYPATLEGAVRSGLSAVKALTQNAPDEPSD